MNNQGISLKSIVRFSLVFAENYRSLGKTKNYLTSHRSTVTDLKHYYTYVNSHSRTERHWITTLETRVQFPAVQFFFLFTISWILSFFLAFSFSESPLRISEKSLKFSIVSVTGTANLNIQYIFMD